MFIGRSRKEDENVGWGVGHQACNKHLVLLRGVAKVSREKSNNNWRIRTIKKCKCDSYTLQGGTVQCAWSHGYSTELERCIKIPSYIPR